MAKKPKPPEHENLERWLVSYADFITLLFATFVVLYALSQTDVAELSKIDESLQRAFSTASILQGNDGVLDSGQSILDSSAGNGFIQELMAEYISPKYESQSFEQIEKSIDELKKNGQLEGVDAKITDQGLSITFEEKYLFDSGSAELSPASKKLLDKIGVLIFEKFVMHNIRVEGHTDSMPIASAKYPSNWELSSARACTIVRYMIQRFKFSPSLFTAVGYADTRPAKNEKGQVNSRMSRRVEILVVKTKFNSIEKPQNEILNMDKEEALLKNGKLDRRKVIDMRNYAESKGISLDNKELYNSIESPYASKSIDKEVQQNEDFE